MTFLRRTGRRLGRLVGRPVAGLVASAPVSAFGWAVLAVGLVLGGLGWWRGWVELAVPAVVAVAALVVGVLLTLGRSTYAVDLDLADHRVTVGHRAVGNLEIRNTGRRRLLPARIELPVGAGSADFGLPSLAPRAVHTDVFAVPTSRRAVIVVGPVRSVRGDPLGLARRRVTWTQPAELHVHPELVSLSGAASGVLRDLEGQATQVLSDSDISFHALREYEAGDDRRHIHWKTSARTGHLMVRQFEDTRRTHTAVALATASGEYAEDDEFELAVAVAASIGVQALRDERQLTVLAGTRPLRTGSPAILLDDVAGLEHAADGRASVALGPWVTREAADASVAILVTGSRPDRRELRAATSHLPGGMRAVVLSCVRGGAVEAATHGPLSLAQLGALRDLPEVLRKVVAG